MQRSEHRILTTHAGSLIRPPEVARAQAEVGIDVVSDGEFSKASWGTYSNRRVAGFRHDPERPMAIDYTGRDAERFAEFFEAQGFGGNVRRRRGADVCVIAGTDCGFRQGARIERVHPTIMWAGLQTLAEGARLASRELWPA
jgi:hypothetical protein